MDASPQRPRNQFKKPSTGYGFILYGLAFLGLIALVGGLAWKMKLGVEGAAAPKPAGPAVYKPLAMDDAVLIEFKVTPRDARLLLDGDPLPSNPARLPRGAAPRKIVAHADGFSPAAADFVADQPKTIELKLKKQR